MNPLDSHALAQISAGSLISFLDGTCAGASIAGGIVGVGAYLGVLTLSGVGIFAVAAIGVACGGWGIYRAL